MDLSEFRNDYKLLPFFVNYISGLQSSATSTVDNEKKDKSAQLIAYYTAKSCVDLDNSTSSLPSVNLQHTDSQIAPVTQSDMSNPNSKNNNNTNGQYRRSSTILPIKEDNDAKKENSTVGQMSKTLCRKNMILHLSENSKQSLFYSSLDAGTQQKIIQEFASYCAYFNNLKATTDIFAQQSRKQNIWIPALKLQYVNQDNILEPFKLPSFSNEYEIFRPSTNGIYGGVSFYPKLLGETKFPGLVYHSSVEHNNNIYITGGLKSNFEYSETFDDISNFYVDGLDELPHPMDTEIVNNPNMIGNTIIYVFNAITHSFKEFAPKGDAPPPLLGCKGSLINERYIFYYGGMEIITETMVSENASEFYLKRRALVNNTGYILDIDTFTFTKVELMGRPNKFVSHPTTVPRFGQTQVVVSKSKNLDKFSISCTNCHDELNNKHNMFLPNAIMIIIFGGYKQVGDSKFQSLNDLWSVEIPIVEKGKRNYTRFGDTAFATLHRNSIGNTVDRPSPRGFHSAVIVNKTLFHKANVKDEILENLEKNFVVKTKNQNFSRPKIHNINKANSNNQDVAMKNSKSGSPTAANIRSLPKMETPSLNALNNVSSANLLFQDNASKKLGIDDTDSDFRSDSSASHYSFRSSSGKLTVENSVLIVHGGTNELGETLGDFWCFDLDKEVWESKTLKAANIENNSLFKKINYKVSSHKMIASGEYLLSFGGVKSELNDYRKQNSSMITLIHLPTLNVLNVNQIDDLEHAEQDLMLESSTLRASNGIYYICGGILRHCVDQNKLDGEEIVKNESKKDILTKKYLHGAILSILAPTVTTSR